MLSVCWLAACSRERTTWEFMPDMMDQISVKTYEPDAYTPDGKKVRVPVVGTVARDFQPYPYLKQPELAGTQLKNPLPRTMAVLKRGEASYKNFCFPCHGATGLGNGPVVPKFPQPPSLLSDKVQQWSDGRLFHVMTEGQALMPSYAAQVPTEDRWAIVHFVRALQRAGNPTPEDVKKVLSQR